MTAQAWRGLVLDDAGRSRALTRVERFPAPCEVFIETRRERRTPEQNALMWAVLTDIAEQLPFPIAVNGRTGPAEPEGWKLFLTGLMRGDPIVPCGHVVVVCSEGTSGMTKSEMADLIEFLYAYGSQRGVTFRTRAEAT